MTVISGHNWQINGVKAVLFDKDGTFIDSHIYWGQIIRCRAKAIINAYGLSKERFSDICTVMGLELSGNRLLQQGPIALVSREEVIRILCDYLRSINVSASKRDIADLFVCVHKEFLPDIDRFALHKLQELIGKTLKAYDTFEFHIIYHTLYNLSLIHI